MKETNNKGFSLVELVIVIAIMAVLVVVIAPQYTKFVKQARVSADIQTASEMASAINIDVADPGDSTPAFTSDDSIDFSKVENIGAAPISKLFSQCEWIVKGDMGKGVTKIILVDKTAATPKYYEAWPDSSKKDEDTHDCSTEEDANGLEALNP